MGHERRRGRVAAREGLSDLPGTCGMLLAREARPSRAHEHAGTTYDDRVGAARVETPGVRRDRGRTAATELERVRGDVRVLRVAGREETVIRLLSWIIYIGVSDLSYALDAM